MQHGRLASSNAVLVTGASGFVGRHLCRALGSRGATIRGLVRPGSLPLDPTVEAALAGGLDDREAIRRALDGIDTVVHLAGRVHVMDDRDPTRALAEFRRANVEGTRLVLEEAIRAGVRRFIFASSVKAMGEGGDEVLTESHEPRPLDPYGISKLEAEMLIRETGPAAGLHTAIVRLPLVYGPGVRANFLRLLQLVDRGVPLPFGRVRNRRSLAFVGNVAAAIIACLESPEAAGETFLVSDGQDLSTPELVREIAAALGRTPRLVPVPASLFRAAGIVGDALSAVIPAMPLTSAAVSRLLGSLVVDSSKLRRLTGFRPPFTVRQGLTETAEWYRSRARVS